MVRKRQASAAVSSPSVVAKKSKEEDGSSTSPTSTKERVASPAEDVIVVPNDDHGAMKCIAILPGIGKYTESSDSEKSTDTEDEYDFSAYDWVGRKITRNKCGEWVTEDYTLKRLDMAKVVGAPHCLALYIHFRFWSWAFLCI